MLFKLATFFMIAATTHLEQAGKNQVQWIYDSGPNKGYLCALVEQDGAQIDVYLPAAGTSQTTPGTAKALLPVPWVHYASEKAAFNAVAAYCPVTMSANSVLNNVNSDTGQNTDK